jgi:L-alanine-DL-glutamate epimerase-like enolase superfamily enzyme
MHARLTAPIGTGRMLDISLWRCEQVSRLSEHRIAGIEARMVHFDYPRLVGKNAVKGLHGDGIDVQVRVIATDQGAVGWGWSYPTEADMADTIPRLIGRNIAELIDPEIGVIDDGAVFLDVPLHDLAGVILGMPVYEMLGSNGKGSTPCYDGMIYMDDILPEENPAGIEAVLNNCRHDYELGYRAFKLKIGRGHKWMPPEQGLQRDTQVTRAVREEFPKAQILVDGNNGFQCDTFLRYLDAVADCDLYWIEEPFQENREDLERLRRFLNQRSQKTLIAEGEAGFDRELMFELAGEKLVDVFLPDIIGWGFTNWRRMMPELTRAGVFASPHCWGDPLKSHYVAHLAAGLGNVVTIEGVPATSGDVDLSGYRLCEGDITPADEPGFGMRLDRNVSGESAR